MQKAKYEIHARISESDEWGIAYEFQATEEAAIKELEEVSKKLAGLEFRLVRPKLQRVYEVVG